VVKIGMPKKDPRVDAYIVKASDFAKPILTRLRGAVHKGCPGATETLKWGVPAYEFRGILCMTPGFKAHCALLFWKSGLIQKNTGESVQFRRITSLEDLPSERVLVSLVKEAARLNAEGIKRPPRPRAAAKPVTVPTFFTAMLKKNSKARAVFASFPPRHKREYIEWIDSAKTDETRRRRMAKALEWMASGKSRNWKYQ
jgi:uncharacterized protein YdeI (YjbR/CyaY-like superfamily)